MRISLLSFLFAGVLALVPATVTAQPGTLDPSFGMDGVTQAPAGPTGEEGGVQVSRLLPDGSLVVAGSFGGDAVAVRFDASGEQDVSFADGGVLRIDFGGTADAFRDVAVAPDGDLVWGGQKANTGADFDGGVIVRTDPSGTLDASFGDGGTLLISTDMVTDARGIAVRPSGETVLLGAFSLFGGSAVQVLADGSMDPSFGSNGFLALPSLNAAHGAYLYPDGQMLVSGSGPSGSVQVLRVLRLQPSGTLDEDFGVAGIASSASFPLFLSHAGPTIDQEGRILVGGNALGERIAGYLVRFLPDGTVDPSLTDGGGSIGRTLPRSLADIATQRDGRIVVFETSGNPELTQFATTIYRIEEDGSLDESFGEDGVALLAQGPPPGGLGSVALRPTGEIVASYGVLDEEGEPDNVIAIQLENDGLPVASESAPTPAPSAASSVGFPFPNPAATATSLHVPTTDPVQVDVYDIMGRRLAHHPSSRTPSGTFRLPVSDFAPGLYLIRVTSAASSVTRTVIVR